MIMGGGARKMTHGIRMATTVREKTMTGMTMAGAATETEATNAATLVATGQNATARVIESAMGTGSGSETETATDGTTYEMVNPLHRHFLPQMVVVLTIRSFQDALEVQTTGSQRKGATG